MVGIISAMQEEIQALLDNLENVTTSIKGMRTYYQGNLFNKKVVLVFSRWGKVASAATTTQLINDFNIDEIVFTGVAGSIKPNLNIGDILVGSQLIQHDINATPFFEKFAVPILDQKYFKTNKQKRDKLLSASRSFIHNYHETISKKEATNFKIKRTTLNKELPQVDCVEMEGAAVAQVCYEYEIPFSIIRIISDNAHINAHIEFREFVNTVATKYALAIFKTYLN